MNVQETSLREALARGRTLPAGWYTDPELFEREQERIFAASWNYVGRVEQVAKPGDFLTGRVDEIPVVIVRDEAGTLRAYANVCRHRGSELVLEKTGNRRTLQCHYHAWTWGLDGALRAAPHCQEQAGFNKADFPLTPLGVGTFGRFIFINPGPTSCSLAATLGQLPAIIRSAGADIDALTYRERREYPIRANWKVVVENFLECYHCAVSHPGFADLIDLDKYQVVPFERCSVQRGPPRRAPGPGARRGSGPTRVRKGSIPISGRTSCSTSIPAPAMPRRISSSRSTSIIAWRSTSSSSPSGCRRTSSVRWSSSSIRSSGKTSSSSSRCSVVCDPGSTVRGN